MRHLNRRMGTLDAFDKTIESGEPGGVSPRTVPFDAKSPRAYAARLTTFITHAHPTTRTARHGFTLVEMMISVGLVLLMMSLFAQIFQVAGASISKQRGLMENDQRARTLQTIIKGDLDKRTFRKLLPFAANEDVTQVEAEVSKRRGYFYFSENDPNNQLDDVLQYTVQSSIVVYNKDVSPYYGRALQLTSFNHPNQPDTDDAQLNPNNTGLSTLAEVSYFVRNGSLYRRQLLIREPIPVAGSTEQPQDANGDDFFDPSLTGAAAPFVLYDPPPAGTGTFGTSFWNDFDYSARLRSTTTGAGFLGANSLNNDATATVQIGRPTFRFGHDVATGRPKEFLTYTSPSVSTTFIGRYTLQECSDANFRYPQRNSPDGNPMAPGFPDSPGTDTDSNGYEQRVLNGDGVFDNWRNGTRRGEDLLMSNVHSFDVQLWDDAAISSPGTDGVYGTVDDVTGMFVDIGGTNASDYAMTNNKHDNPIYTTVSASDLLYGPTTSAATNRVFDTWHPQFNLTTLNDPSPTPNTTTGQTIYDDPPFRPLRNNAESITGTPTDVDAWSPDTAYAVGALVFPSGPPGSLGPVAPRRLPYGLPFYYRCIESAGTGLSGLLATDEPSWPRIDGLRVIERETYDPSTTPPTLTNRIRWQAVENRKPLKAIKLEIRFVDTSTQQMRQLTIIQSLVD